MDFCSIPTLLRQVDKIPMKNLRREFLDGLEDLRVTNLSWHFFF